MRRIQVSDVVKRVSNCCCSVLFKHPQLIAVGCKVATISPKIFVVPLPALLKKGEMVRAVSPSNVVALKISFASRDTLHKKDLWSLVYLCPSSVVE